MTQHLPLDGIVVVTLEQAVAAPMASARLAAAGARVIKIERPGGDFARRYDRAANGVSSYFAWLNQGKESIVLDLVDKTDQEVMKRMLDRANVFIQNLAVGAIDRLGFGHETLRARRPEMITCDISGYGTHGPYAAMKAYDLLVQAESGLISISGAPGPLGRIGVSVADIATGINAATAISQALVAQQLRGEGAAIHVSLFDSLAEWMTVPLLHHDYLGEAPKRVGLAHPGIAPYGAFTTGDGQLVLISIQSDREWKVLCESFIERGEFADDPRFATNIDRVRNRALTDSIVGDAMASLTSAVAEEKLRGCRIAYGRVNDVAALGNHSALRRVTVTHESGTVAIPAAATGWGPPGTVPSLDQHGDALRVEFSM